MKLHSIVMTLAFFAVPSVTMAAGPVGILRDVRGSMQRIQESGFALAPYAFAKFCRGNQEQCADTGGDGIVELTEDRKAQLLSVNSGINRTVRPVNDADGSDEWSIDVASGDCEDYALTKRKHLISLGWPSGSLRMAVARTRSGEGHAVLVAKTSAGDLVLDNRSSEIKPWKKTDLTWIMMQSQNSPRIWVKIGPSNDRPTFVANQW